MKHILFLLLLISFGALSQTKTKIQLGSGNQITAYAATAGDSVTYAASGCGAPTINMLHYMTARRGGAYYLDTCTAPSTLYLYTPSTNSWSIVGTNLTITWAVEDSLNDPSALTPTVNDKFLVGPAGAGDFSGQSNNIATYTGTGSPPYTFDVPSVGDLLENAKTGSIDKWTGSIWLFQGRANLHAGGETFAGTVITGSQVLRNFQVITNDIRRINVAPTGQVSFGNGANIYFFPTTNSSGVLTNNGSGTLTWSAASSGVTSVATGLGLSGGTITTTGTIVLDTASAVVLSRQRAAATYVTSVGATSPITTSGGLTPTISTSMATNKLIGRGTSGTGVMEEITLGTNLSLSGTTLNATGGSGNVYAPLIKSGDTISQRFNVLHYGADNTGATDATAAIQAAINDCLNTIASTSAYRGVVYFPLGKYKIAGSLLTTDGLGDTINNAQLYIPYTAFDSSYKMGHIVFMGEVPPSDFTTRGVVSGLTPPTNGVTLITTKKTAGYILAGAHKGASAFYNRTYNELSIENINFRVASKSVTNTDTIPVMGAVDAYNIAMFNITNSRFDTESPSGASSQPATSCIALRLPAVDNWTRATVTNTTINNYYTGIVASEHAQGSNVFIGTCFNGIELLGGVHGIHFDRLLLQWNVNNIKISSQSFFSIDQLDIEEFTTLSATKWYNHVLDIYEPILTNSEGEIFYKTTTSDSGTRAAPLDVSSTISPKVMYALVSAANFSKLGVATSLPQAPLHVVGTDGKVAAFPTIGTRDFLLLEDNNNANIDFITSTTGQAGIKFFKSGAASENGKIFYDQSTNALSFNVNGGTTALSFSSAAFASFNSGASFATNKLYVDATNSKVGINTASPGVQLHVVGGAGVPTLPSFGAADALAITNNANANLVWVTSNTGQAQIKVYATSTLTGTQCYDNSTSQWRFGANATNASTSSDVMIGSNHKFGIGTATTDPTAYLQIATAGTTAAGTAPIKIPNATNLMTTAEAGAFERADPKLYFTNGGGQRQEIPLIQQTRVSTQFDKTSNVTLANITGLTATLVAGKIYRFEATLFTTSNVAGGVQVAIAGTATATAIIYEGLTTDAGLTTQSRATALATAVGAVTAVTNALIKIEGTITCNAAGTLTVQFAQNASNGTASSVLVGSTFVVTEMN